MDHKKIAAKLLILRGEKTLKEVSAAIGVSIASVQRYESGKQIPSDDVKIAIANYYGKTVQSIFYD